jgi:hypothetical protein
MPEFNASTSTLSVDIGGSGIKVMILDANGNPITERARSHPYNIFSITIFFISVGVKPNLSSSIYPLTSKSSQISTVY